MRKNKTGKDLKKELDRLFSIWVRMRHSVAGQAKCVTCGKISDWRKMQAGHYFKRNLTGTRWDIDNVHVQCPACNVFKNGNYTEYAKFMYDKYGVKGVERLRLESVKTKKYTDADYEEYIDFCKRQIKELEKNEC